jgi:hypothetical protein
VIPPASEGQKQEKMGFFPLTHSHLGSLSDTQFVIPTKEETHKAIHKKTM